SSAGHAPLGHPFGSSAGRVPPARPFAAYLFGLARRASFLFVLRFGLGRAAHYPCRSSPVPTGFATDCLTGCSTACHLIGHRSSPRRFSAASRLRRTGPCSTRRPSAIARQQIRRTRLPPPRRP